MTARTIAGSRFVADLRAGMDKADLMAKYRLSEDELTRVLAKLAASGAITEAESHSPSLWRCPACHTPQPRQYETCPQCGVIIERFMASKGAHQPVTQEPTVSDALSQDASRLRVKLPPVLRALWLILGVGTALTLVVVSRPFRDLSWSMHLFLGLLLAVVLSVCAWFLVKGVYLLVKTRNDLSDETLIAGVVAVAGIVLVVSIVLTCLKAESVRIKYKFVYGPMITEINDDLEKLGEGLTLPQYTEMERNFAAQLKRIRRRLKGGDPSLTDNLKSARANLRNAGEHWSKLADLEETSPNSLGTAYEDFARIKQHLVQARKQEWDLFRDSCRKALEFMDDRTR